MSYESDMSVKCLLESLDLIDEDTCTDVCPVGTFKSSGEGVKTHAKTTSVVHDRSSNKRYLVTQLVEELD